MDNIKKHLIFKGAVAQFELDPFGIHGVNHWHRVFDHAMNILRLLEDSYDVDHADEWFLWNFAMLHDSCRTSDLTDIEHPYRAAKMIPDDDSQFNVRLRAAILGHSSGKLTNDRLAGICWDADRLDLPRIGIVPDPDYMSTKVGREFAENMRKQPEGE